MKKLFILAVLLMAAACVKNYPMVSGTSAMGSCDGQYFISDEGVSYKIVQDNSTEPLGAMDRVYVSFDVIGGSGKNYDIRVLAWSKPLVKDWVKVSSAAEEQALGSDPIRITKGWMSGGYINMDIMLTIKRESETKHVVNLCLCNPPVQQDTLRLAFRHNGNKESIPAEMLNTLDQDALKEQYATGSSLVCFPTSGLLPDGSDSLPFKITTLWTHHDEQTGKWLLEEEYTVGILRR